MGVLDLGKLKIGITVDNKEANKGLEETKKETEKLTDKIKKLDEKVGKAGPKILANVAKTAKNATKHIQDFAKKVAKAMTAVAVAISGATVKAIKDTLELTDAIDKNSQKLGISAEAYQKWGYVFERNGANIDNFARSMKTMIKNANEGSDAFKKLGVSVKDSAGRMRSQEEIMNDTIMALASMDDVNKRNALAMEIFGNQWTEILPLLNQGKEALEEQYQFLEKYGLVISDDAVQAGVKLGDTINDIRRIMSAFGTMLGSKFVPQLQQIADFIMEHAGEIISFFNEKTDDILQLVNDTIEFIMELVQPIADWVDKFVEEHGEELVEFIEIIKTASQPVLDAIKNGLMTVFNIIANFILPIFERAFNWLMEHQEVIQGFFDFIAFGINVISGVINGLIVIVGGLLEAFGMAIAGIYEWITETLIPGIGEAWDSITGFVEDVAGIATDLYNAGKNAIDNFLQGLQDAWDAVARWADGVINTLLGKFGSAKDEVSRAPAEGKHRTGLREVPYDGYIAELHKGEMVLTAPEANAYQNRASGTQTVSNITVNNYSPKALTEAETARQFRKTQRKLELGFGG